MQHEVQTPARSTATSSVSRLALASFLLGLLAWPLSCLTDGVVGMVAVMLGMVALDRIRASAGALRGRAFAWTGIGTGTGSVLLLLGAAFFFQSAQQRWNLELDGGVRRSFAAKTAGEAADALDGWTLGAGQTVDAEAMRAFAESVRSRYGAFDALLVSGETPTPDLLGGRHSVELQVDFEFAGGRRPGAVRTVLIATPRSVVPEMRLEGIVIEDPDAPGGRIEFPPPAAPPAPPAQGPITERP